MITIIILIIYIYIYIIIVNAPHSSKRIILFVAFSRVFTGRTITYSVQKARKPFLHCGWTPVDRNGPIDCFQYIVIITLYYNITTVQYTHVYTGIIVITIIFFFFFYCFSLGFFGGFFFCFSNNKRVGTRTRNDTRPSTGNRLLVHTHTNIYHIDRRYNKSTEAAATVLLLLLLLFCSHYIALRCYYKITTEGGGGAVFVCITIVIVIILFNTCT